MIRTLVFTTGAILMALEMLGSRFLAPQYGNSIVVWASLISVFLAALASGYWLGGMLADRWQKLSGVAAMLTFAGILTAAVPLLAPLVFRIAGSEPRSGSLLSSFGIFFLPTMLMAAVSPWAIRLHHNDSDRLGRTAGGLYAISTVGSIAGTIVTAFWLIPTAGVANLTRVLGVALLLLAGAIELHEAARGRIVRLAGIVAGGTAAVIVAAIITAGVLPARTTSRSRTLFEKDTLYQHLRVVDDDGVRILWLNNSKNSASVAGNPLQGRNAYTDYLHLPMALSPRARDVLFIGLGGGTVPLQYLHDYPNVRVDVAEIDPDVVTAAHRFFGFPANDARLRVFAEDGRRFLERSDRMYDLIIIDAFHDDFVPFHLTTREFFQLCRKKMRPGGNVALNIIGPFAGVHSGMVGSLWQTLGSVFSERYLFGVSVAAMHNPGSRRNCIVIAGEEKQLPEQQLYSVVASARSFGFRDDYVRLTADYVPRGAELTQAKMLSDDYAPVEDLLR